MTEQVLFSGGVQVSYGQASVACDEATEFEMEESFAGQVNGLCGAAVPASLLLVTGINYGTVQMAVELHKAEPSLSDVWEEIVEVPFANSCSTPAIVEWGGDGDHPFLLEPGNYRVRYCGRGMDASTGPGGAGTGTA